MRISYNAPAMVAHNALTRNDNRLTESLKRLSSGLKVVEAKDNPAGMAMGKRMNAQLKGLSVATQNSSDAISAIETADGALSEVHEILQRMNHVATASCGNEVFGAATAVFNVQVHLVGSGSISPSLNSTCIASITYVPGVTWSE